MKRFRLPLLALSLPGCTAEVRESDLLRPLRGGALTAEAVTAAAPAYSLSERRIAGSGGDRLYAVYLRLAAAAHPQDP